MADDLIGPPAAGLRRDRQDRPGRQAVQRPGVDLPPPLIPAEDEADGLGGLRRVQDEVILVRPLQQGRREDPPPGVVLGVDPLDQLPVGQRRLGLGQDLIQGIGQQAIILPGSALGG